MRNYYVYALLDPSNGGLPFYVGKGRGYRRFNHYCASYLRRRSHKSHIIQKYRSLGFTDQCEILADGLTEAESFAFEIEIIKQLGRRCDGGLLVNQSGGGEGCSGHSVPRTEDCRKKIALAHVGKTVSEETRRRQSEAAKHRVISAEARQAISLSMKGRKFSEAHHLNLSLAIKGRQLSASHKAAAVANLRPDTGDLYEVKHPDGSAVTVRNLAAFCRERGLSNQHLGSVALGKRKHHRGYTARKILEAA
jgi:hypothetical protein